MLSFFFPFTSIIVLKNTTRFNSFTDEIFPSVINLPTESPTKMIRL